MRVAIESEAGVLRWSASFAFALIMHALTIGLFLAEGRAGESAVPSQPIIMLDLIALPVEPAIAPEEAGAMAPDAPPPPAAVEAPGRDPTEAPSMCGPHVAEEAISNAAAATTLTEWKRLLQHHLEHYKRYPADAQRKGQQGTPHVFFTVCRDGRVLGAQIVRTSGFASLDQAGIDLVRRAEPLPAFPQGLSEHTLNLVVPVEFFLAKAAR